MILEIDDFERSILVKALHSYGFKIRELQSEIRGEGLDEKTYMAGLDVLEGKVYDLKMKAVNLDAKGD